MKKILIGSLLVIVPLSVCVLGLGQRPPAPAEKTDLPDIVVTKVEVAKPKAKGKKKATITYTLQNQGRAPSQASRTQISISASDQKVVEHQAPALKPGETFTTSIDYDLAKSGNYRIKVTADYINKIPESNERNNENSVRFSIGRSL